MNLQGLPWKATYEGMDEFRHEKVIDCHFGTVCDIVHGYGPEGREVAKDTANLIAAAPELLAALKAVLPLAIHVSPQDIAVDMAKKAIVKAGGQL